MNALLNKTIRRTKRLIVTIIGFSVLLIGIAMIVLPGSAIIVIPIGLGLLATEFIGARILLTKKDSIKKEGGSYAKETK